MGNRVLKISNADNNSAKNNLEVYRDISMISRPKKISNGLDSELWIHKDINVKAVFNSLRNIFNWIPGERVLLPDFGSRLRYILYEQITENNTERIISEIKSVCLKYEPRVNILKVNDASTVDDTENNTIRLDIIFTIPSLGTELYNYSYICNTAE